MPTSPSIHLIRGSVAHLVLEHLFTLKPSGIAATYKHDLQIIVLELLKNYWNKALPQLESLGLTPQEFNYYFVETQQMLLNWLKQFINRIEQLMQTAGLSFSEAFTALRPITEIEYTSSTHGVHGFIDAIEEYQGTVRLMDYKTSSRPHITDAYRLQLAIYALLYEEKHGKRPQHVGIYFLKDTEQLLPVNDDLLLHAKVKIEEIHAATDGANRIEDYPMKPSPLCKWSGGQCDFYDYCFNNKPVPKHPPAKSSTQETLESV